MTSLELDSKDAFVWYSFSFEGGGEFRGRDYTAKDCYLIRRMLIPGIALVMKNGVNSEVATTP